MPLDPEDELNGYEDPFPDNGLEDGDDWLNSTEHDDDYNPQLRDDEEE